MTAVSLVSDLPTAFADAPSKKNSGGTLKTFANC